jgi:hypothetical protein
MNCSPLRRWVMRLTLRTRRLDEPVRRVDLDRRAMRITTFGNEMSRVCVHPSSRQARRPHTADRLLKTRCGGSRWMPSNSQGDADGHLNFRKVSRRWSGFGAFAQRASYLSSAVIICIGIYVG